MTYHRTTGKGGTIDRSRDQSYPGPGKSTKSGSTRRPSTGKRVAPNKKNPPAGR